jgi:hypothetical protein
LLGTPASITTVGGPANLALIAINQITDFVPTVPATGNNAFDLAGLGNVLLATQAGAITFNSGLNFQNSGATVPSLTLYARGGVLDLEAATLFNLPGSPLNFYSDTGITDNAVISAAGNVTLISGGGISMGGSITSSGSLALIAENGNISVNSNIQGSAGNVALTADAGTISLAGNVNSAGALVLTSSGAIALNTQLQSAGPATLTSTANSLTLAGLDFYTTGAPTASGTSDITLAAATSVSVMNSFVSTTGGLTLTANNGNVLIDGNCNLQFVNSNGGLTATALGGSLAIQPATDGYGSAYPLFVTGTADNGITIDGSLDSAAANGAGTKIGTGISLTATGGDINANAGIQSGAGNVAITADAGAITLAGSVDSAGALSLTSSGAIALNTYLQSVGPATLTSTASSLALAGLDFYTTGAPTTSGTSDITLVAATGVSVMNSFISTTGGLTLTANNGNVLIDGNCNLQFVNSNGGLTATAHGGSLTIQPGTDGYGGAYPLFVTGTAENGITINGSLESASANATGTETGTGISLTATGGDINANAGILSGAGDVAITASAGTITLAGSVNSAGALSLTSSGAIALNTQLQSAGPATLTSTAGSLTLAGLDFYTTGAPTAGGSTSDVALTGATNVSVMNSFISTTGGLSLTANDGDVLIDGNCNLQFVNSNGGLTASAHGGSLTIQPGTDGYGGSYPLFVTGTADNGITIDGALDSAVVNGAGTRNGTGISLAAAGGNINVNAGIQSGAGNVAITAADGTITLAGSVNSAGSLTLASNGAIALNTQLQSVGPAMVTSTASSLTLASLDFFTIGAPTTIGTSDITLTAATSVSVTNSFISTTGGLTLTANNGNVLIDGNCNLQFVNSNGGLTATAHGGSLTIQPSTDGYGSAYPLFVTGTADTGIVIAGSLESEATNAAGTVTGTGISLTAKGGDISANASIQSNAGDVAITADAGTITLAGSVRSAGALSLTSSGAIALNTYLQSVGPATVTSTANSLTLAGLDFYTTGAPTANGTSDVTLAAAANVSVTNSFISTSGALALTSTTGNISIDGNCDLQFVNSNGGMTANARSGSLTIQPSSNGYGSAYPLFFTGTAGTGITLGGSLETAAASNGGGIQLTTTAGDFNSSATIQSNAGDIVLSAPAGVMNLTGSVDSAGSLTLSSGGAMTVTGNPIESVGPASLTSSAGVLSISSLNFYTTGAPVGSATSDITLSAPEGVSVASGFISSSGAILVGTATGNISITGGSYLQFVGTNGGFTAHAPAGSLTLQLYSDGYGQEYPLFFNGTAGTGITLSGTLGSAAGSNGTGFALTTTGGDFNSGAAIQSYAGNIVLSAPAGVMNLSGSEISAGSLTLSSGGTMTVTGNPVESVGPALLTSTGGAISISGLDFYTTGAPTANGTSDIALSAATGVTIANSFLSSAGSISLTTTAGDISLDANSNLQFVGDQGGLTLKAPGGSLTLSVASVGYGGDYPLGISATAGGAVAITTTLAVVPSPADPTATGGQISLNAGTTLNLSSISVYANGGSFTGFGQTTDGHGGSLAIQAGGPVSISSSAVYAFGGANSEGSGGSGGTITIASTGLSSGSQTSVGITGSSLYTEAGTGGNGIPGGGGTITITSADATAAAANAPAAILLDGTTLVASENAGNSTGGGDGSGNGGTLMIGSARTAGPGITVQNYSQLVALNSLPISAVPASVSLSTAGADITVTGGSLLQTSGAASAITLDTGTAGGTINVTGNSTLTTASNDSSFAPGSTVSLNTQNSLPTQTSAINLTDATLSGDVLKVQALGTAGHITIGGSSVLSGNSQLILYAGTSTTHLGGIIEFVANTTLESNVAGILAATTIQIDGANTVVTVTSPAPLKVYGDVLNYAAANGGDGAAGYGSFAGTGAPTSAAGTFGGAGTPASSGLQQAKPVASYKVPGGYYVLALDVPPRGLSGNRTTPAALKTGRGAARQAVASRKLPAIDAAARKLIQDTRR